MNTGPRLLPHVQFVALDEKTLLLRRFDECMKLRVNSARAQQILERLDGSPLERCLEGLSQPVQALGQKLVKALDGTFCTHEPMVEGSTRQNRVALVAGGAWGAQLREALAPLGETLLVPPPSEDDLKSEPDSAVAWAERLLEEHDLLLVVLESVSWAAARPLNRAALASSRAAVLFLSMDPGEISVGPVVGSAQPPCLLCERLALLGCAEASDVMVGACERLRTVAAEESSERGRQVAMGEAVRMVADCLVRRFPHELGVVRVVNEQGEVRTRRVEQVKDCPDCSRLTEASRKPELFGWGGMVTSSSVAPFVGVAPWERGDQEDSLLRMQRSLLEAGTAEIGHAITSFHDHLVGTWTILDGWGVGGEVSGAGLFHSVYGTDAFDRPTFAVEERARVRTVIGAEAERLVYLFCTVDRELLARSLSEAKELPVEGWEVRNWRTGERARLAREEVSKLLVIEVANLADQSHGGDLLPGWWVARCGQLARLAASGGIFLPFVTDVSLTDEEENRAAEAYRRAVTLGQTEPQGALEAALEATRLNPWVGEPWLLAASLVGDERRREWVSKGMNCLSGWLTAWDKRMSWTRWMAWARRIWR